MPVSDQHKDYTKYLPRVQQVRDCVEGAAAIKSRTGGVKGYKGEKYLPSPEDADTARYEAYRTRANYVNFTGHTKDGMIGMVTRKPTVIELPESLMYLEENANGGGLSLEQYINETIGENLEAGRYGVLVDYPAVEGNLTKAQIAAQNLQANLLQYPFESVINWRTEVVGGVKKLSLVVLQEPDVKLSDDGFTVDEIMKHRVLRLVEGVYTQQLYDENDQPQDEFTPTKSDGSKWDEIPFIFIGAQNNDETIDKAPLYDLSEVNLGHYRNSADYEESCYMVGQPTPVFAGLTTAWAKEFMDNGVVIGSRKGVLLPEGATSELMQAAPNTMPAEGMEKKETQMVMIGARIIQDSTGVETAEAAKIRFAGQNSKLGTIVQNVEQAVVKCVEWAQEFMGGEGDIEIDINKEFYDKTLDPQLVMAMIQLSDRGDLGKADIRESLRRAGWTDKSDEELDEGIDDTGFNLGGMNNQLTATQGNVTIPAEPSTADPQLAAILERIVAAFESNPIEGQVMPRGEGVTMNPTFNIEIPEGFIQFPENMVSVTVGAPEITVEGDNSPTVIGQTDKDIGFEYNESGAIVGGKLRVVRNED